MVASGSIGPPREAINPFGRSLQTGSTAITARKDEPRRVTKATTLIDCTCGPVATSFSKALLSILSPDGQIVRLCWELQKPERRKRPSLVFYNGPASDVVRILENLDLAFLAASGGRMCASRVCVAGFAKVIHATFCPTRTAGCEAILYSQGLKLPFVCPKHGLLALQLK